MFVKDYNMGVSLEVIVGLQATGHSPANTNNIV